MRSKKFESTAISLLVSMALSFSIQAQVIGERQISIHSGGIVQDLTHNSEYGSAAASIGDAVIAIGIAQQNGPGAVIVQFLNEEGSVSSSQLITDGKGGFPTGLLDNGDRFGSSIAELEQNPDGSIRFAISASGDDDEGDNSGAVYIVDINQSGVVTHFSKDTSIGRNQIANAGDRDNNGTNDLLTTESNGALSFRLLGEQGEVLEHKNVVANQSFNGQVVASIGDIDRNGVEDVIVGDPSFGNPNATIVFLNSEDEVIKTQTISATQGGVPFGLIESHDGTFMSICASKGSGKNEIFVGAPYDNDGDRPGAMYRFVLNSDGTVSESLKVNPLRGTFPDVLDSFGQFGQAVACLDDIDNDGGTDIIATAPLSVGGGKAFVINFQDYGLCH